MKPIRLVSGFLTVGIWTLLSRVFGFARDILIAAYLGTGAVAEAFLIAFALPNMFRRFFAEGAFNMAFVPMFARKLEAGEDAEQFAQEAFVGMTLLLRSSPSIGIMAMPALVWLMASGFYGDERFPLAVEYGRIAFPYILFISLAALLSGVLNATGRFVAAAAAPVLLNMVFIVALVGGRLLGRPAEEALGVGVDHLLGLRVGDTLAASVPIGGIVAAWPRLVGGAPRGVPDADAAAAADARPAAPRGDRRAGDAGGRRGADQPADRPPGGELLRRRGRLAVLCRPAVPAAAGRDRDRRRRGPACPTCRAGCGAGDEAGGRDAFSRACEFSLALTIPAAVALVVIPLPLVSVLFQRGAFGADDTAATALAVAAYGLGLPAFVLQKMLPAAVLCPRGHPPAVPLRDRRDGGECRGRRSACRRGIGFIAAALGTTLAGWAMVWLLWRGSRGDGRRRRRSTRGSGARIWRIVLASVAMGAILWGAVGRADAVPGHARGKIWALALLVAGRASPSTSRFGQVLGAFRLAEFRRAVRR